jgi:hypothetical protein
MLTKIALAATLIVGSVSAIQANEGKVSEHARGAYTQVHVRPSPDVNSNPSTETTGALRPLTEFERDWFDFQDTE